MRPYALLVAAIGITLCQPAAAAIVFTENFNRENGGASAANYVGFSSLVYRFGPSEADLESHSRGLVRCAGNTGSCLALNGPRTGIGYELWTRNSFAFKPGDFVNFRIQVAGNPASIAPDIFNFGLALNDNLTVRNLTLTDRTGTFVIGQGNRTGAGFGAGARVAGTDNFFTYIFGFEAVSAGFVRPTFGIPGLFQGIDDAIGPVVDNLSLEIRSGAVPEPTTWAMMIVGFGFVGASMRRRAKVRFTTA